VIERFEADMSGRPEPVSQIIPAGDPVFAARFGQAEEHVPAIAANGASCPGADLSPCDLTADIVLGAVGVEWDFRSVQYHQQLSFVRMKPRQQAIQRGEAGATAEDVIEPGVMRETGVCWVWPDKS
jgi:hypothetical protein